MKAGVDRQFLNTAAVAGTGALFGLQSNSLAAEPPPETTRIRLYKYPGICLAPQYMAEGLLTAEGFTDVQYVEFPEGGVGVYERLGSGAVDITQWFVAPFVVELDRGSHSLPGRNSRGLLRVVRERTDSHDPRSQGEEL